MKRFSFQFIAAAILSLGIALFAIHSASAFSYGSDLTIKNIEKSNSTSAYTDFSVVVENIGTRSAEKSWIGIYTGETFRRACPVRSLAPLEQDTISCRFYNNTSRDKSAELRFFIDDMEEIREKSETNNTAYVKQATGQVALPTERFASSHREYSYNHSAVVHPTQYDVDSTSSFGDKTGQYITCHFSGETRNTKKCDLITNTASSKVLFCTNELCRLKVYGNHGSKVSFQGICGGTKTTVIDGSNKNLFFSCPQTQIEPKEATVKKSYPQFLITENENISFEQSEKASSSIKFGSDYDISFNNGVLSEGILNLEKGDYIDIAVAFEDIDDNLENYIYKKIPRGLSVEQVIFPESVECRTKNYSEFSTIYCRGQESFSEIIYRLKAIKTGQSDIYGKIRYTKDDEKVLDTGYISVIVR